MAVIGAVVDVQVEILGRVALGFRAIPQFRVVYLPEGLLIFLAFCMSYIDREGQGLKRYL